MPTTIGPAAGCSASLPRREAALTEPARELVAAAQQLLDASSAPDIADADPRTAIALVGDALGHLGVAVTNLTRQLEAAPDLLADRRHTTELARRMHELVSSLSYARYSAHLACREVPRARCERL